MSKHLHLCGGWTRTLSKLATIDLTFHVDGSPYEPRHNLIERGAWIMIEVGRHPTEVEAGKPPQRIQGPGFIDTGSKFTIIDEALIEQLGIMPRSPVPLRGYRRSSADDVEYGDLVFASLAFPGTSGMREWSAPMLSCPLATSHGEIALIGRDFLSQCTLTYEGPEGRIRLVRD